MAQAAEEEMKLNCPSRNPVDQHLVKAPASFGMHRSLYPMNGQSQQCVPSCLGGTIPTLPLEPFVYQINTLICVINFITCLLNHDLTLCFDPIDLPPWFAPPQGNLLRTSSLLARATRVPTAFLGFEPQAVDHRTHHALIRSLAMGEWLGNT
jgi:hypothetical protein